MELQDLNLPLFLIDIDDKDLDTGAVFTAVTTNPAIEKKSRKFNSDVKHQKFQTISPERRIVMGPVMVPNLPIYRKDDDGREYYVMFSKACIEKIAVKYFENNLHNNVNDEHDPNKIISELNDKQKKVVMFGSIITDKSLGITTPAGWGEYPEGTWFVLYKVKDDKTWEDFKEKGEFGFSIEGTFLHKYIAPKQVDEIEALRQEILTLSSFIDLLNKSELKS